MLSCFRRLEIRLTPKAFFSFSQIALVAALCQGQGYTINSFAGTAGTRGFAGDGAAASAAQLAGPSGLALDNSGTLYIVDQLNQRVRAVSSSGSISTIAGNGTAGYTGDGKGATSATLFNPFSVAVDGSGNVYIADTANNVIRKVSGGNITTVAGNQALGGGFTGDGGAATNAQLDQPGGIALDSAGNLYISDTANQRIRMVSGGTITTIAGIGFPGPDGDGGLAINARLSSPRGLRFDNVGNLYIADSGNHKIRKIFGGVITTIAGKGTQGFAGDNGPAITAFLNRPLDVAADTAGNVYIADYNNSRIRRVAANGVITTVAGDGLFGFTGDGGAATNATLNFPSGVVVDSSGKIYIADNQNNVVRLATPPANLPGRPTITSGGVIGASSYGGFATVAPGSWIEIYGSNLAVDTNTWGNSFQGPNAPTSLDGTTVTIGGQNAFVEFVSSGQVNAQLPSTITAGTQQIIVSTAAGASASYGVTVNPTQPGLYAPASLKIGGKQYVGALFPDGKTYVLPVGAVPSLPSRPAKPGETIILYGVGFGLVSPDSPAGIIVASNNTLVTPLQINFGNLPVTLNYMGLAPGAVGLYQFNAVVPNIAASDAVPVTFMLGGTAGTQTLFTSIGN